MPDLEGAQRTRLVRVSPGCAAFVGAALSGVFGAIGLFVGTVVADDGRGSDRALQDMLELMCPVPLVSAFGGFVSALIGAWVFNALAQSIGGLPVTLVSDERRDDADGAPPDSVSDDPLVPPPGTSKKKTCPECGETLRADRTFCAECGYDFDAPEP